MLTKTLRARPPTARDQNKSRSKSSLRNENTWNCSPALQQRFETVFTREDAFLKDVQMLQELAEKLKEDQALYDGVTARIERRVTHVLSFQIAIDMFHRFLTERESHARLVLTDPLDDLANLERRVASLEESLRTSTFDADTKITDRIAAANFQDELAVELLESKNTARRLDLSLKRLLQARPPGPRVLRIKLAATAKDWRDRDGETEIADGNLKRSQDVAALVAARQQRLDRIEGELADLEGSVDDQLQKLQSGYEAKEELVRQLIGRLHEVDGLMLAIDELHDGNAKLRGAFARIKDEGASARRQAMIGRCWEEAYDVDKEGIRRSLLSIEEKTQLAARRDQRNQKRAGELREQAVEVAQKEEEAEGILKTILEIEGDARNFEKQLNQKLREARELAGVDQGDQGDAWIVAETDKVWGICGRSEPPN
jgi:myosin heavy subunit